MGIELLLVLTLFSCHVDPLPSRVEHLPYFNSEDFTPRWIEPEELPDGFHRVPPFSFTNQRGENVTETQMNGQVTVVDFFFTFCPGICPRLTKNMGLIDSAFPESNGLLLLSHSVTPEHDTVEKLSAYATEKNIDSDKWHLLTGDRTHIYDLARSVYFAEEDMGEEKGPDDFLHTESFILVDDKRHIRGVYNGLNQTSVRQLIVDIQTLKEAQ